MESVTITYFVHGTTTDNENDIATGWNQGKLSTLGKQQCLKLKKLVKGQKFDVVFCSDLKRAVDSAKIVFGKNIIKDRRLRECNYGDLNGGDSNKVGKMTLKRITEPFSNGESYEDVENRVRDFLKDLLGKYLGRKVAIVSHRGPQLALDVVVKGKTWKQAIENDWRVKGSKGWKPGWSYKIHAPIV